MEAMLESDGEDEHTIGAVVKEVAAGFAAENDERESIANIGRRLGPYQLIRQIGRGGMGAVYQAIRADDQYLRAVAIKLIAHGSKAPDDLARFRIERQILATMQHPNIAALLDGGSTEDGQPYIVMEYIEGEPLVDYARRNELSINERLKLFRQLCSAVQHAHQMLVIHRDIKPSNVMVTGEGVPKLLDFGIAKLLLPELVPGHHTATLTMMRRMTPQYASPEQIRGEALTTATDIYSLGVLLYELLTFESPYRFTGRTPHDIERAIRETDPIKLSSAVKGNPRVRRQLAGDLENIVSMALRKEPSRRYASVQQLSDDVARHLDGMPVSAREDTLFYVAGKLVKRNKLASLAFALLLLSVAAGWTATVQQAHRAEARFAQVRKLANSVLFDLHKAIQKLPGSTPVREQLVTTGLEYLNALSKDAAGDDSLQWELSQAYELVGDVQGDPAGANLGQYRPALASYRKAMSLVEEIAKRKRDYEVLGCLSWLHLKAGDLEARTENQETALKSYLRGLEIAQEIDGQLHDSHARTMLSQVYQRLATSQMSLGNLTPALENVRLAVDNAESYAADRPGPGAKARVAQTRIIQGNMLWLMGDLQGAWTSYDYAVKRLEETIATGRSGTDYREQLQEAYRRAGDILGNPSLFNFGDAHKAEQYHRNALSLAELLAERDARNARAKAQLYDQLRRLAAVMREEKPAEAAALYERSLNGVEALWNQAPQDLNYLRALANTRLGYAHALSRMHNYKAALVQLDRSLSLYRELLSRDRERQVAQEDLFENLLAGGEVQLASGSLGPAQQYLNEAYKIAQSFMQRGRARLYEQRCLALIEHRLGDLEHALARHSRGAEAVQHRHEASSHYENALAIWSRWRSQNLGVPYSTHQERIVLRAKNTLEGESR